MPAENHRRKGRRGRDAKRMAHADVIARKAVALRLKGASYQKIAITLGLAVSSVYEAYKRGLAMIAPDEDLIEERKRARLILDGLREKIQQRLEKPNCALACFDTALRIEARIAELMGLNSAVAFDVNLQSPSPSADQQVARIQATLSLDEQRQLVGLLRRVRNGNGNGDAHAIETTSQRVAVGNSSPPPAPAGPDVA